MIKLNAITEYDLEMETLRFEYMCLRHKNRPDKLDKRLAEYRQNPICFDDDVLFDQDCRSMSWAIDNGLYFDE